MAKDIGTIFPFREKLFIGVIKFFDCNKGFGYIACNNLGMETQKRFNNKELCFYIDNDSLATPIAEKKVVVFRPAIREARLRAEDVHAINLETDYELLMYYYEHNNFIYYEEKVKTFSVKKGHRHFEGFSYERQKVNILMRSGVTRYELLNEYSDHFSKNHDYNYLLKKIDKIIQIIDGETTYNNLLRSSYVNIEKEIASWKRIFSQLTEEQIYNLVEKHPSLQLFAPDELLIQHIEVVDEKWGVSDSVKKALRNFEEAKKFNDIKNLIDLNFPGKSREEIERICQIYDNKLSAFQKSVTIRRIDELTLSQIKAILNEMPCDNSSVFIQKANRLSNEYKHLSIEGKLVFRTEISHIYEQKIITLVDKYSKLEWYNFNKIEVKNFLLKDTIIQEENYSVPQKILKDATLQDYYNLFVQSEKVENPFSRHLDFEKEYACLFNKQEHEELLSNIENKCLEKGSLFSIERLFSYIGKKLPENIKGRFLCLPLKEIVSNVSIMSMFEDSGCSIVGAIVDKICETNDFFFHKKIKEYSDVLGLQYDEPFVYDEPQNIEFAKELVAICGKNTVEQHFAKLKKEDRQYLFVELQLNIISSEELKEYLLNTPNTNYQNIIKTDIAKNVIISIIMDSDCSKAIGIRNASLWLNRYVGNELDYKDKGEWIERQNLMIDNISRSNNEYLKVLTWALFFQSSGKMNLLKDVFYLYPTDLQIRILKKFFYAMAINKYPLSLDKLKKTIGGDIHKLSLPVEIVLKFLSLKIVNNEAYMTDDMMLSILQGRDDYNDWFMINKMLNPCNGRKLFSNDNRGTNDAYRNFNGIVKKCIVNGQNMYWFLLSRKQLTINEQVTQYNNTLYGPIKEYISIVFTTNDFKVYQNGDNMVYYFTQSKAIELRIMAEVFRIKMEDVNYYINYEIDQNTERFCCECRVSDNLEKNTNKVFLWCRNRPCFHSVPYFHISSEWENYTVLDFMRILSIPTDYKNLKGKITRHGQYTIFSTYILSFHEFLEHLKCRQCGKLMEPCNISNFARSSITEFECTNSNCQLHGQVVYLNKCFNPKCNSIIDSRDSKKCPNNSYICERCGACCSTKKFSERLNRLQKTGGYISKRLQDAIQLEIGHWEKNELYCSSCGKKIDSNKCSCGKTYELRWNPQDL